MSLLDKYKLNYESLEDEKKIWRTKKTDSQQFRADRAGRLGEMARHLVQRFFARNGNRAIKANNK